MRLLASREDIRAELAPHRRVGRRIGFVPTMGALHAGHASLVERAVRADTLPVLSIFVNPLQFGPGEDYRSYPRDLDRDIGLAQDWGVDLVFAPDVGELIGGGAQVTVDPGSLAGDLEGAVRPEHFRGVLTIVAKLLNVVRPDLAVFGQKDLQQAVLVRSMVRDLDFEVDIDVAPTVREADGLALSSRNAYLTAEERKRAAVLFRALCAGERRIEAGERRPAEVRDEMLRVLATDSEDVVDYVAVRRADDLAEVEEIADATALLGALRVGRTRLIDNVVVAAAPRPR